MQDLALTQIAQATARSVGKRSRLYREMKKRHADLTLTFSENGPGWSELVKVFARLGWTDREGKRPSIRTAQDTWYRVCRDVRSQSLSPGRSEPRSPPPTSGTPPSEPSAADPWAKVWGEMDRRSGRLR